MRNPNSAKRFLDNNIQCVPFDFTNPDTLVSLVLNERYSEQLPGGVTLRCSTIASERRIELVNALLLADRFVAVGCFTEIIQWRKRLFIPTSDKAASILAAVIEILG